MYHPPHPRGRSRMERDRGEYDEYNASVQTREMYHTTPHPQYLHHGGPPHDMYSRSAGSGEHRSSAMRESDHTDYHPPHRASSRRVLNAI